MTLALFIVNPHAASTMCMYLPARLATTVWRTILISFPQHTYDGKSYLGSLVKILVQQLPDQLHAMYTVHVLYIVLCRCVAYQSPSVQCITCMYVHVHVHVQCTCACTFMHLKYYSRTCTCTCVGMFTVIIVTCIYYTCLVSVEVS